MTGDTAAKGGWSCEPGGRSAASVDVPGAQLLRAVDGQCVSDWRCYGEAIACCEQYGDDGEATGRLLLRAIDRYCKQRDLRCCEAVRRCWEQGTDCSTESWLMTKAMVASIKRSRWSMSPTFQLHRSRQVLVGAAKGLFIATVVLQPQSSPVS